MEILGTYQKSHLLLTLSDYALNVSQINKLPSMLSYVVLYKEASVCRFAGMKLFYKWTLQ